MPWFRSIYLERKNSYISWNILSKTCTYYTFITLNEKNGNKNIVSKRMYYLSLDKNMEHSLSRFFLFIW
jgi:hypothetical protein